MNASDLQQMIDGLTTDIRIYQQHQGWLVIFDPTSEAYRLVEVRGRLQAELRRING